MNSHERVTASVDHREPDRVPFDLGATPMTGMHTNAYRNLRKHLGFPELSDQIEDRIQQLAHVDEDVHQCLKTDVRCILPGGSDKYQAMMRDEGDYTCYTDEFGVGWRKPKSGGFYFDMYQHPF